MPFFKEIKDQCRLLKPSKFEFDSMSFCQAPRSNHGTFDEFLLICDKEIPFNPLFCWKPFRFCGSDKIS